MTKHQDTVLKTANGVTLIKVNRHSRPYECYRVFVTNNHGEIIRRDFFEHQDEARGFFDFYVKHVNHVN